MSRFSLLNVLLTSVWFFLLGAPVIGSHFLKRTRWFQIISRNWRFWPKKLNDVSWMLTFNGYCGHPRATGMWSWQICTVCTLGLRWAHPAFTFHRYRTLPVLFPSSKPDHLSSKLAKWQEPKVCKLLNTVRSHDFGGQFIIFKAIWLCPVEGYTK